MLSSLWTHVGQNSWAVFWEVAGAKNRKKWWLISGSSLVSDVIVLKACSVQSCGRCNSGSPV